MKREKKGSWWIKNTTSIPPVYHQYTMVYGQYTMVYGQYTTSIPQRRLQVWTRDFVFTWWCNETFFNFSLKISLHCIALRRIVQSEALTALRSMRVQWFCFLVFSLKIALHCIALHCIVQSEVHFNLKLTALRSMRVQWICFFLCSVWNAFQLKPDSTEIYENSVFVFQRVMHFSLSLRCALHSQTQEQEKRGPRWNHIHLVSVTCLVIYTWVRASQNSGYMFVDGGW